MIDVLNGGVSDGKNQSHRARQTPETLWWLPAGQAKLAVQNGRTSPNAPARYIDRRGWRPSRRKPQDSLYFSIDYLRDQCELA
jgi:hypothetical protein